MNPQQEPPANSIPSDITTINESTPLLFQEQYQTGSLTANSGFQSYRPQSIWSLSINTTARQKEVRSIILLLTSSLLFAIVSAIVKYLGNEIPSFEIVLVRSIAQLLLGLVGCLIFGVDPLGKKCARKWIFFRAVVNSTALFLFYYALTTLTLLDTTVIFFVSPIFRIVIASGTLNESYSAKDGFYSIICFIALLLVIKPCSLFNQQTIEGSSRLYGISCALIGTYMSAMSYITVRKIGSDTHALVHMVYSGFVASCFGLFICLFCWQEFVIPDYHQFKNQFMLGSIGVFAFLGQCLLNEGLKLTPFGLASLIHASDVTLAFLFGAILFEEHPGFYSILGSTIAVFTITAINVNGWHRYQIKAAVTTRRRPKERLVQQQRE